MRDVDQTKPSLHPNREIERRGKMFIHNIFDPASPPRTNAERSIVRKKSPTMRYVVFSDGFLTRKKQLVQIEITTMKRKQDKNKCPLNMLDMPK